MVLTIGLGKQGQRVWQSGEQEIWTRPLSGGAIAVALFNCAKDEAKVTLRPADLKLNSMRKARDLWIHQDVKWPADGEYSAVIPSYGVVMLKLTR